MSAAPGRRAGIGRRRCSAALAVATALTLGTGCTPSRGTAPTPTTTSTVTVTSTATLTPSYRPPRPTTVAPLLPDASPRAGERETSCPYIASTPQQDARRNVADIVGSHVYRTVVLTRTRPRGCRFFFYAPPFQAIADIVPRRLASATDAHNAMVLTATRTGTQAQGVPRLAPRVSGVLFRTAFFGPDERRDWACVFAVGRLLVVVHTDRSDTSLPARQLAAAVARRL